MDDSRTISIWFFVGVSLLLDGVLIFGAGVYQVFDPPKFHVVLFHLHANVWWGALLAVVGAVFSVVHWPWRSDAKG